MAILNVKNLNPDEYEIVSSPAIKKLSKTERAGNAISKIFPGKELGNALGTSLSGISQAVKQRSMKPLYEAGQENAKNYGKVAGDTGQIVANLLPLGGMQSLKGLNLGQKALGFTKNIAKGALGGYGIDVTQKLKEGETGAKVLKPGSGTAIGASIPAGMNIATGAKNLIGRGVSEVSGALTGQGYGGQKLLLEAIERGGNSKKLAQAALRGKVSGEQIKEEADAALGAIFNKRSAQYQKSLQGLMSDKQTYDISPVTNKLKENLADFKVKATPEGLDFSQSPIRFNKKAQQDIATIYEEMKTFGTKPGDRTVVGLDSLKRAFGDLYTESGEARKFVTSMKQEVRSLLSRAPGYDKMSDEYAKSTDLIKDIQRDLSIGDKKSINAAWGKFRTILRNNNEARADLLRELDAASGGTLLPQIAGELARPMLPRGLTSLLPGGSAVGAGLGSGGEAVMGGILKALVIGGASVSPRLAGEVINILGLSRKYTKPVAKALNSMLLQFQATKAIKSQVDENQ